MDLGQIFTNEHVAEYMVSLLRIDKNAAILDPCFGEGAFIKACLNKQYHNICGYELDKKLYNLVKKKYPQVTLHNQDFLQTNTEKLYDIVIMNPPYIRHEKINELNSFGITKEVLIEQKIFQKLPKTANLYMYFIMKAIGFLKDKGELIVIFPSSWLKSQSGKQFERMLYSKCSLKKRIHISGEVFEQKALVEVAILHLVKGYVVIEEDIEEFEIVNGEISNTSLNLLEKSVGFDIQFNQYASIRRGLTTGYNSMFINPTLNNDVSDDLFIPIISSPKSINGYSTKCAQHDNLLSISPDTIFSEDLMDYISAFKEQILNDKAPKTLYNKIVQNTHWYHLKSIDSKGIIFSYFVRNDMKFIENNQGTLVRDNFYIIYPKVDKMLLFALLNNYYTYYQLEKFGKKYGAGLLKIQKYDIEELSFPDITNISQENLYKLIDLAKRLCNESNRYYINEITRIISRYSNVSYEDILSQYQKVKTHRLEGYANGN